MAISRSGKVECQMCLHLGENAWPVGWLWMARFERFILFWIGILKPITFRKLCCLDSIIYNRSPASWWEKPGSPNALVSHRPQKQNEKSIDQRAFHKTCRGKAAFFWHALAEGEKHLFGSLGCTYNLPLGGKKTCPNWLGLRSNLRCKRHSSKAPIRKTPTCFHKTHSYFPLQNPSSTVLELLSCTSVHHLFQILGSAPGLMESSHSPWRNSPKNPPHPSCQTCSPSSQGMPPHPFGNHQCLCHPTTRRWPDHPT